MNSIPKLLITVCLLHACSANREIYLSPPISEKSAYHIELLIEGEKNKELRLCKYLAVDTYPVDTALIDKEGKALFAGNQTLVPGMYAVMTKTRTLFDILISDTVNQKFSLSATKDKYPETLSFKNSPENEAFADYSRAILERQKKETKLKNENSRIATDTEIDALTGQIEEQEADIKAKYAGRLIHSLAMAMNPPRPKRNAMTEQYVRDFLRQHYWDKFNLTDNRLTDTPVLAHAIDRYFDRIVAPNPDSVIHAIDFLLPQAENDTAMISFLAGYIFNKYRSLADLSSDLRPMWIENPLVHLIDNYYLTGRVNVNDEEHLKNIAEYADKNRATLTGKQAKELKMETLNGAAESLYDIDAPYILLCFFDPSCSHCEQEIPEIYKIFQKYRNRGLAGFCVNTRDNRQEWIEFVSRHNITDWINVWDPRNENDFRIAYSLYIVPQIYLLDANRKITGRGLNRTSLTQLLNDLIKK
jgi:peroxiredoxin